MNIPAIIIIFDKDCKSAKFPIGPICGANPGPMFPKEVIAPLSPNTVFPSKIDKRTASPAKIRK